MLNGGCDFGRAIAAACAGGDTAQTEACDGRRIRADMVEAG